MSKTTDITKSAAFAAIHDELLSLLDLLLIEVRQVIPTSACLSRLSRFKLKHLFPLLYTELHPRA